MNTEEAEITHNSTSPTRTPKIGISKLNIERKVDNKLNNTKIINFVFSTFIK